MKKKSNYPSNWPRISKCITWQKKSVQPYWVAGRVSQRTAEVKSKCHRFLRSRPEHRTECCGHQLSTQADLLRDIFVVESFRQMSVSSLVVESLLWFGSRQQFHFTLWSIINTLIWKFSHFRILIITDNSLSKSCCVVKLGVFSKGNVHKGRSTILGHFGHTYLPMSDVFYTMPISSIFAEIPKYLPQNRTSFMNDPLG